MKVYGNKVTCNRCGDSVILYSDMGKQMQKGKWVVSTICPICNTTIGRVIEEDDPETHEYNIGDYTDDN